MKRLGMGRGLVVPLAATILAVVASVASYAVSSSSSHHSTVIANTGRGSALTLRNKPAFPPLTVSSSKRVAHLNADLLDGRDSSQLEPNTWLWTIGRTGQSFTRTVTFAVPAGWYEASAHATAESGDMKPHDTGCYIYPATEVESGDYTNLIAHEVPETSRSYVAVAGVLYIQPHDRVVVSCSNGGGADGMKLLGSLTFTLRPVHVAPGPGSRVLERR